MATTTPSTPMPAASSPAPVIVPDWTADSRIRRLLASFATTPPPSVDLPRAECWGTQTTGYTGFRVACLRILRDAILGDVLRAAWAVNDTDALATIADAVTVEDAVADAIRIPTMRLVTMTARPLNPLAWGLAA